MIGWLAHDLSVFLIGGQPSVTIPQLIPGSAAAVAIGAALGWLTSRRLVPVALATLGALCVASVAPRMFDNLDLSVASKWLPRAMFTLDVALVATLFAVRRGYSAVRTGVALGLLACIATTLVRQRMLDPSWPLLWAALLTLALTFVPKASLRRVATVLVLLLPLVWTVRRMAARERPVRADLPQSTAAAEKTPNLLLVVLDTVRSHRLAPYGHTRTTTPRLDQFVEKYCTRYENARSTSSWTLSSHASLFTGLYPAVHGATHPREGEQDDTIWRAIRPAKPLRKDVPTIAEVLRNRGYRTAGIVGNSGYLFHGFGVARGFEHYDDRNGSYVGRYLALAQFAGRAHRAGHTLYREADQISTLALDWLEQRGVDEPFFLMLNYMDAHDPYMPPPPYHLEFGSDQPVDPLNPKEEIKSLLYDRSLVFLDAHLARVLEHLEARGQLDDTVVIVTADHGEAFGEHGTWTHAWTLHEEVLKVPLYIKPIGPREVEVVEDPISGVDVFPLAMSLLGFGAPPELRGGGVIGEWYHGLASPAVSEWGKRTGHKVEADLLAWLEGDVKYIVDSMGTVKAYDLKVDPGELQPLELTEAQKATAIEKAESWWKVHPPVSTGEVTISEDDAERLKALGYTGN